MVKGIADHPLAVLPDCRMRRGFAWGPRDPIEDGHPRQRQHVTDAVESMWARRRIMTPPYQAIMNIDLTDDETAALARLFRGTVDNSRFSLSPRLTPLRAILDKLEPPKPKPEPRPPLKAYDAPSAARRRRRG
jgi:hypothetical protein